MDAFINDLLYPLFAHAPLLCALLAGALTFLSPCILPLIPAYMSYISGMSVGELKSGANRGRIALAALLFTLGFSAVFIILGLFIQSVLGNILNSDAFRYAAGAVIIIFGAHFLGLFRVGLLYKSAQARFAAPKYRYAGAFVLGVSFSLGWTPCVGPILASIFSLSLTNKEWGAMLMVAYCVGLGASFLLTALLVNRALNLLKKAQKYLWVVEKISGLLLIFLGVGIVLSWF